MAVRQWWFESSVLLVLLATVGCGPSGPVVEVILPTATRGAYEATAARHLGLPFGESAGRDLSEVAKAPDQFAGQTVRLTGQVAGLCKADEDCLLHLESKGQRLRVVAANAEMRVDRDVIGARADVEGTLVQRQKGSGTVFEMEAISVGLN